MKTTWDLKLLYKNDSDPQIERDIKRIEKLSADLEKKYKNKDFTRSAQTLVDALKYWDKVVEETDGSKPWWYFALINRLDSSNTKAEAMATKIEQRLTEASNKIKFFSIEIKKIPLEKQKAFLKHPLLKPYRRSLERTFRWAKYTLTEREEQLEDLLQQTSYTMWVDSQDKLLTQQTVIHAGKEVPISKAIQLLADLPDKRRQILQKKIYDVFKSISHGAEAEINAIYNFKYTMDKRRGFKKPYSSTVLSFENEEKSIEQLVSLVSKYFRVSHRFYKLHAKLIGKKKLTMADRFVKIGKLNRKFSFADSVSILRSVLGGIDHYYVELLDTFIKNGQIDVYPKKGKNAGAFCWGVGKLPTFLLLNHNDNVRSLETLAHEIGHAIHTELSKKQPHRYRSYSTATAEVASTFFEQAISNEIEKKLTEKEKIIYLHNKISGDISTVFRQIACFNFENELHNEIRKNGQVPKEAIAGLMRKHLESYVGNAVFVSPDDGFFFVYWSHIRRFFYVYSYAYGQLVSRALYEKWRKDHKFAIKVRQFLSAGRSMSPEDIFKSIGVDVSKLSFFETGLKGIENDIKRLENLTRRTT